MGVIVNGPRKAGTHALKRIVRALGFRERAGGIIDGRLRIKTGDGTEHRDRPACEVDHLLGAEECLGAHDPALVTQHTQIRILRQPKNIAVSKYRSECRRTDQPATVDGFRAWIAEPSAFIGYTAPFFRWIKEPDVILLVWYETLFSRPTLAQIAYECGLPDREVKSVYGASSTWSGRPSNWTEWFTPEGAHQFDQQWAAWFSRPGAWS